MKGVDYEIKGNDRRTWAGGRKRERRGQKERMKSKWNYKQRKGSERKGIGRERYERIGKHE